ncbi:hypothetical protein BH11MYX4_BH11MYX4_28670 [soil metagenome]
MTPVRLRWALHTLVTVVIAITSVACGASPVRPDSQLMAGWVTTELDLGEASVQLEHPSGWPTKAGRKAEAFPAGDIRVLTPLAAGPRVHVTTFAVPKGFPTAPPDLDQKAEEMVLAAASAVSKGKAPSRKDIMRVEAVHGGSYKVVRVDDESVPADSTDPEKFKYATLGVLARDGWIVSFTIFHHEAAPPLGEEVLGVVRTVRVVAKPVSPPK